MTIPARQAGFLLLPVVALLSVAAVVAFWLTRQGASAVATLARETDAAAAQYVTEAGLNHALWRISQADCATYGDVNESFGDHSYSVVVTPADGSPVSLAATGTLANGARATRSVANLPVYSSSTTNNLELQPGPEGIDTFIWDGAHKDTNFGTSDRIELNNASAERNILMRFDLSAVPGNAPLLSATLSLYLQGGSSLSSGVIDAHRVTRSWHEGVDDDVGPPTAPGATYRKYDGTNFFGWWASPGGDYDPTPVATTIIPSLATGWYQWDVTELAQGGQQSALASHGMLLTASGGTVDKIEFTSSDGDPAFAPKLALVLGCECGQPCAPAGSTLPIAHWQLDETGGTTAVDTVGGHDGTLRNGPVWSNGLIGGGLLLDGSNDYVDVPHDETLSLSDNMSFAAWANTASVSAGYQAILTKDIAGNGQSNYWFGIRDDELLFGFWAGGSFREVRTSGLNLLADMWHHLAATFDNTSDEVRLYLDGTEVQMGTLSWAPTTESGDVLIGNSVDDEYWDGTLDDVRIYNRVLDGSDIAELAVGSGPIAHWKLDDGSGSTAIDSEGTHDGTVSGASWASGQDAGALNFDGSNDFANLTSDEELDDLFVGGATFMAWIRPTGWGESGFGRIVDKAGNVSGARDGWSVSLQSSDGSLGLVQGFTGDYGYWDTPPGSITLNDWQHLAVVYDASSTANDPLIYLDGVLQTVSENRAPAGSLRSDASFDLTLGNYALATSRTFDGDIDDVRVYDRMLSQAEIAITVSAMGGGGGSCADTYRDEFNEEEEYDGSDGSLDWSTDWLEINESDGPDSGDERVRDDDDAEFVLQVRDNDGGGEGAQREADLSGYASARLSFDYRRDGLDNTDDYVKVEVSANGGSSWTELDRFEGPGTDNAYQAASYDISAYIAANTRVRFITSPSHGSGDEVYFDNVEIGIDCP